MNACSSRVGSTGTTRLSLAITQCPAFQVLTPGIEATASPLVGAALSEEQRLSCYVVCATQRSAYRRPKSGSATPRAMMTSIGSDLDSERYGTDAGQDSMGRRDAAMTDLTPRELTRSVRPSQFRLTRRSCGGDT
jgi:hypothetical protein